MIKGEIIACRGPEPLDLWPIIALAEALERVCVDPTSPQNELSSPAYRYLTENLRAKAKATVGEKPFCVVGTVEDALNPRNTDEPGAPSMIIHGPWQHVRFRMVKADGSRFKTHSRPSETSGEGHVGSDSTGYEPPRFGVDKAFLEEEEVLEDMPCWTTLPNAMVVPARTAVGETSSCSTPSESDSDCELLSSYSSKHTFVPPDSIAEIRKSFFTFDFGKGKWKEGYSDSDSNSGFNWDFEKSLFENEEDAKLLLKEVETIGWRSLATHNGNVVFYY